MQFQDNLGSIIFIIFYLTTIWLFLGKIIFSNWKKHSFKTHPPEWKWIFAAYFLLGFGDIFHLGSRILVYFAGWGPDDYLTNLLVGSGLIITGITMTYFYIAIFHAWSKIYGESHSSSQKIKLFTIILYTSFIARIILVLLPYNRWYEGDPTIDFGFNFRFISNIPIYIVGLLSVYLLIKSSNAERKIDSKINAEINRGNFWASISYLVSYACYTITILFVDIYPLTGMFMIPKTIAYLVAFYFHYTAILNREYSK